MAKKKQPSKKPTHSLEELDVREVSLVDRPANQRRFLIVKSEDSDLSIAVTEAEDMAKRTAVAAADATAAPQPVAKTVIEIEGLEKFDPLAVLDDAPDADPEVATDTDTDPNVEIDTDAGDPVVDEVTPIAKQSALDLTGNALSKLMETVNAISKADDFTAEHATALEAIAKALHAEAVAVDINSDNARSESTDALSRLMQTVNLVKALDDEIEELPEAITEQVNAIAATLIGVAKSQQAEEVTPEETDQVEEPDQVVYVGKRHANGDLDLIIKRGAKMKQTRLSKLQEAAAMLTKLIEELEGEAASDGGKDGKKKTTKGEEDTATVDTATVDTDSIVAKVLEGVNGSIAKVATEVNTALNGMKEEIAAISKRVDDVDGTVPGGNATEDDAETSDDGEPVKKSESLFASVVGING